MRWNPLWCRKAFRNRPRPLICGIRWLILCLTTLPGFPALSADPVSNGTFTYETNGKTYELYSQGYKSTGAIHLRYRKAISGGEAPPPLR